MTFRDLIFGRRNRTRSPVDVDLAEPATATDLAAVAVPTGLAEAAVEEIAPVAAGHPGPEGARAAAQSRAAVLPGLILGVGLSPADRQRAMVAELSGALSLRQVAVAGTDRSAWFLVANRRLLAARFVDPHQPLELDLRHDPASEPQALALRAALEALLTAPVDLVVETRSAAGVFAADAGLPVDLLMAEKGALRAAFAPPDGLQPEDPPLAPGSSADVDP